MSHLKESDRMEIEHGLRRRMSFHELARKLGKSRSTILREVLRHRVESLKGAAGRILNRCVDRRQCDLHGLCKDGKCNRKCSACRNCNAVCPKFREEVCPKLSSPPYVCNGCLDEYKCVLRKKFYIHSVAHGEYRKLLLEARRGANLTEDERREISDLIYAGTRKGQSIHHIMAANKDSFTVCEKTVYRYVNAGLIRTKRGDMLRSCSMKPRKRKHVEHKVDTQCRIGRTYDDFKKYREEHPGLVFAEMDSVHGGAGGKALLTVQLNNCGLLLAFLRPANNSQTVIDTFNMLEEMLTPEVFRKMFPVLLTDNGSEFTNPLALEASPRTGERRTAIFYCNPYSSWQKGHVENNHTNLRKIIPKGRSLAEFTQDDINVVLSHVNSFCRKGLNDVPATILFETLYGKEILRRLGIVTIDKNEVCLLPSLINK